MIILANVLNTSEVLTPPKSKVIADHIIGLNLTSARLDVIYLAATRIDVFQIDSRRKPAVVHHFDGKPGFQCAARAECMAKIAFLRTHRHKTKYRLSSQCFGNIAFFGRRTVAADIADFIRRNTRRLSAQAPYIFAWSLFAAG